jgi:hypothetical protein
MVPGAPERPETPCLYSGAPLGPEVLMSQPPQLTPEQRRAALDKAAQARQKRAEVKEQLKSGRLSLSDLFAQGDADEMVGKLKVVSMLESMPGVGKVRARRLMQELDISESRRLRGLGDNQRRRLLDRFA